MKAKSIKGNSPEEIKSALQQSMADGFKPTLAIVFISIKQDRKAVSEILQKENIDLLGATSCGEFINGYQDEGGIVILLLDLNRDAYTLLYEPFGEDSLSEPAEKLSNQALKTFNNPSMIVLSTGVNSKGDIFDGEKLVNRFLILSRNYIVNKGKLPPLSRLNREIRPVRLFFEAFDMESLKQLY